MCYCCHCCVVVVVVVIVVVGDGVLCCCCCCVIVVIIVLLLLSSSLLVVVMVFCVVVVVVVVVAAALFAVLETSDLSKVKEEPDHCVQTMCYIIVCEINTEPWYYCVLMDLSKTFYGNLVDVELPLSLPQCEVGGSVCGCSGGPHHRQGPLGLAGRPHTAHGTTTVMYCTTHTCGCVFNS